MKTISLIKIIPKVESLIKLFKMHNSASIIALALATTIMNSQAAIAASATSKWTCGAWTKDKNNSCVEIQTCTRSICNTIGKITDCRKETKTSKSTNLDCTPAPVKPKVRTFGKGSMSLGGTQKLKRPPVSMPIPIPYPGINKRFNRPDGLVGKRKNIKK